MTILLAGATGAVGSVFLPRAREAGLRVIPHVRPQTAQHHPLGHDHDALVCDLADAAKLDRAMSETSTIVCLVGTTRRRFSSGDTYVTSDLAPVEQLVASARRVPLASGSRHFVLLSSLGARQGGGYLGFKWRAEEVVRTSGLPWTIFRPSMFDDADSGATPSDGRRRHAPAVVSAAFRFVRALPGLANFADDVRPIPLTVLADAILRLTKDRAPTTSVLRGREIWSVANKVN